MRTALLGDFVARCNVQDFSGRRLLVLPLPMLNFSRTNVSKLTQPGRPSVNRRNEFQRQLGRKQAHFVTEMH